MNSGRMFAVFAAALVISSVAGGCKSGSVGTAPDFYVTPTGAVTGTSDRVLEGGVVEFTEGGGKITMVFGNVGDAELQITDIQVVSKNADMVVSPEPADITFPVTVVAGDYKQTHPTVLKIDVHYQPDADRDLSATVIRVFTNDMNLDNSVEAGVFEFSLSPANALPRSRSRRTTTSSSAPPRRLPIRRCFRSKTSATRRWHCPRSGSPRYRPRCRSSARPCSVNRWPFTTIS